MPGPVTAVDVRMLPDDADIRRRCPKCKRIFVRHRASKHCTCTHCVEGVLTESLIELEEVVVLKVNR